MLKSLNDASVQILTDFTRTAERNRRSVRRATFLAVLAMLVAVLVPAWPYILEFYQSRQPGYQSPQAARAAAQAAAEAREAQTAAAQKQQMDTLKSAVEELRAQRTAAPRPVAD
jgi:valyl-tRNA synthetase